MKNRSLVEKGHFAALKESRTRGLIAERRAVAKKLAWLDQQLESLDPHRLEKERIFAERNNDG